MKRILLLLAAPFFRLYVKTKSAHEFKGALERPYRWYRKKLEGCQCSDGSPYYVYYKKGAANKLVVYFSGGGMSWNEFTAARANTLEGMLNGEEAYYFPAVASYLDLLLTGILSPKADKRNPVREWNFVYIPYASADLHMGRGDFPYTGLDGQAHILHHHGAINVEAALKNLPPEFAAPEKLLIAGESAGAFGCVAHAPAIAAMFPESEVTVYSDGSQLQAEGDFWQRTARDVWLADEDIYGSFDSDGQLIADLFKRADSLMGGRALLLHSNSRFDDTLTPFQNKIRTGEFILNEASLTSFHSGLCSAVHELSGELPRYRYYICNHDFNPETGATAHTISRWPKRYYDDADGISLARWLGDAIEKGDCPNLGADYLEG